MIPKYSAVAAVNIDNSYVLDVAAAPSGAFLAAACSSGAVKIFAPDPTGGLTAHSGGGPGGSGKNAIASASLSNSSSSFAHTKPATALAWHSGSSLASLLSASKDGTVACWDVRLGGGGNNKNNSSSSSVSPALRLQAREPLHSVCFVEESWSPSSLAPAAATTSTAALVAAGGDGKIFLWDARTGRELSVFEGTHEGDVSVLVRAQVRPTVRADDGSVRKSGGSGGSGGSGSGCFLSAGVDGLVAVWDVSLDGALAAASAAPAAAPSNNPDADADEPRTLEDDAFVTALNSNTSVSRMGLFSSGGGASSLDSLWAATGVEGLLTWDWAAACDEADAAGGVGPLSLVDDARGAMKSRKKKAKGGAGSDFSSCDYVVGCVSVEKGTSSPSPSPASSLVLAAGDHLGRLALFPLGPPRTRGAPPTFLGGGGGGGGGGASSSSSSQMTVPKGTNASTGKPYRGHSATVRAITVAALGGRALATGGEDGLVVLWAPGKTFSSNGGGGRGGGGDSSDEDDDDDDDDDKDNADAQKDFSRLKVSSAVDGVTKKKKKNRRQKKKKNKGGTAGEGGGSATAVEMAVE
jgi:hypothetical protein